MSSMLYRSCLLPNTHALGQMGRERRMSPVASGSSGWKFWMDGDGGWGMDRWDGEATEVLLRYGRAVM